MTEANARGGDDNIGLVLGRVPESFVARLADPDRGRTLAPLGNTQVLAQQHRSPIVAVGSALAVVMLVLAWSMGAWLEWW